MKLSRQPRHPPFGDPIVKLNHTIKSLRRFQALYSVTLIIIQALTIIECLAGPSLSKNKKAKFYQDQANYTIKHNPLLPPFSLLSADILKPIIEQITMPDITALAHTNKGLYDLFKKQALRTIIYPRIYDNFTRTIDYMRGRCGKPIPDRHVLFWGRTCIKSKLFTATECGKIYGILTYLGDGSINLDKLVMDTNRFSKQELNESVVQGIVHATQDIMATLSPSIGPKSIIHHVPFYVHKKFKKKIQSLINFQEKLIQVLQEPSTEAPSFEELLKYYLEKNHYFVNFSSSEALLHRAVMRESTSSFLTLLNAQADVNVKNYFSRTPLGYAAQYNRLSMGQELIKRGADVNAANQWGLTPLHFAAGKGYDEFVELLCKHNASHSSACKDPFTWIPKKFHEFQTPLNCALARGHLSTVKTLLKWGAQATPQSLGIALYYNRKEHVEVLLAAGAQPLKEDYETLAKLLRRP